MADKTLSVDYAISPTAPDSVPSADLTPSRMSVIDRRLKNPHGVPSRKIPLRGDKAGWVVRVFTADSEHPNRHYDAVHELGWVPLTRADMAVNPEDVGFQVSAEGRIVRGIRSQDVLMAMPKEDFDRVQKAKSDANLKSLKAGAVRESVSQATAVAHGDQAGEETYRHFSRKEVVEAVPDDLTPANDGRD